MSFYTILDIGTSKIVLLRGGLRGHEFKISFFGEYPSQGIKRGRVIDMEALSSSIRRAIEDGERNLNEKIRKVTISCSVLTVRGILSTGTAKAKGKTISEEDIETACEAATALNLPNDLEIVNVIPIEFIVDGNGGIRDPRGMKGTRLEAKVHAVTADKNQIHNFITCCSRAAVEVEDIILQAIASSEAVLTVHDREIGTLVIDIGAGTTDIALFFDGRLRYINSLGFGGNHITNDLIIGLKTSYSEAERIKKKCGLLLPIHSYTLTSSERGFNRSFGNSQSEESSELEIIGLDRQPLRVPLSIIGEIVFARVEEIFEAIRAEIDSLRDDVEISSVVLTGGTSHLRGITQMSEAILSSPTRVGKAGIGIVSLLNELGIDERLIYEGEEKFDRLSNPEYSSALGSLLYKIRGSYYSDTAHSNQNLFERISNWIRELIGK